MKRPLDKINRAFENRVRLAIMSVLTLNERVDFNTLKESLAVTDGNLATHVAYLERLRYVKVTKQFVGKKTSTTYALTDAGRRAFGAHVDALERLIKEGA